MKRRLPDHCTTTEALINTDILAEIEVNVHFYVVITTISSTRKLNNVYVPCTHILFIVDVSGSEVDRWKESTLRPSGPASLYSFLPRLCRNIMPLQI
jgi:hypothetical protein